MPRSNQGPAPSAATCWPLHHNRASLVIPDYGYANFTTFTDAVAQT